MELQFAFAALIAGMLTILAPCMLPVLPIVVGGSADGSKSKKKPIIITVSLMVSIIAFTMLVRTSVGIFDFNPRDLQILAGWILAIFGVFTVFPEIWDWISLKLNLSTSSNKILGKFVGRGDTIGDVMIGASLGPVFTSCSPTFAVILALVLGDGVAEGFGYLVIYAIGLGAMMLLIAFAGQAAVRKLGWATNPHGWFKRIIGAVFLLVGVAIITGWDKQLETWLIDRGLYEPFAEFEDSIRE